MFSNNPQIATDNLFKAIEYGEAEYISQYLAQGANLNESRNKLTPVQLAVSQKNWKIIQAIAEYLHHHNISVQPSLFNKDPYDLGYALKESILAKQNDCIASLKKAGVIEEEIMLNPLAAHKHLLSDIKNGISDSILDHLKRGAHLNALDEVGFNPIEYSCKCNHWEIVNIMVDYLITNHIPIKPSFFDNDPYHLGSVLKFSIHAEQFALSYKLINSGVNLETTSVTSEILAAMKRKKHFGASPRNSIGMTALCAAIHKNNYELVSYLLNAGANPNTPFADYLHVSGKMNTIYPLHLAIRFNNAKIAALLRMHKADKNLKTEKWKNFDSWDIRGRPMVGSYYLGSYDQDKLTEARTADQLNPAAYKQTWCLEAKISLLAGKMLITLLAGNYADSVLNTLPLELRMNIMSYLFYLSEDDNWTFSLNQNKSHKIVHSFSEPYRIAPINKFVSRYNYPFFNKSKESQDFVTALYEHKHDVAKVNELKYNFFKEKFKNGTYNPGSRAISYMIEEGVTSEVEIVDYYKRHEAEVAAESSKLNL